MSVATVITVQCDGDRCGSRYEVVEGQTVSETRRVLRYQMGWAREDHDGKVLDMCPVHKRQQPKRR